MPTPPIPTPTGITPTPPIPTPTGTQKLVIDSKFRRETSNFKINFDLSSIGSGDDPVLLKYIEKNLKPEELLGTIVSLPGLVYSIGAISPSYEEDLTFYSLHNCVSSTPGRGTMALFYVPSTGALSLKAPYVEEEVEGGDGGVIIVNPSPGEPTS